MYVHPLNKMGECDMIILRISIPLWKKATEILIDVPGKLDFNQFAKDFYTTTRTKLIVYRITGKIFLLGIENEKICTNKKVKNQEEIENLKTLKHLMNRIDFKPGFEGIDIINISPKYTLHNCEHIDLQIFKESSEKWWNELRISEPLLNFFDKGGIKRDEFYPVSIANVYDPSKFWIRFATIDVLQDRLTKFYDHRQKLMFLPIDCCHEGMNCVAVIDGLYYRCRAKRVNIQEPEFIKVFLYDYGSISDVHLTNLFILSEEFIKIPSLAVRAMLTNISPIDNAIWNKKTCDRFNEMLNDLFYVAHIVHIHKERKIVEINLFDSKTKKKDKLISLNYQLISESLAKVAWQNKTVESEYEQFKNLKRCMYLYPTFEMIEDAVVPSKPQYTEELKECLPWDLILPGLYEFHL